jgi:PAS domain S-box-containing protein
MEQRRLPAGSVLQRDSKDDPARVEPHARPVVLVVDDDPAIRVLMRDLLSTEGYRVELAGDGAAARARLERGEIDLLILDHMLPDVDGASLCQQARSLEGEAYLPIILLTARAGREERLAGFAAGADDYVAKPFDVDEMLARVRVWLRTSLRLQERDRRERAREAAALQSSEERFRAFMDHSPTVCFIKDAEGRYVYVNTRWERAFGHALNGPRDRTMAELWPPDVAERFRAHDRAALAAGSAITETNILVGADGSPHEWWCCKFPFHDVQGRAFLGGIALDITERRRLEEQLRQAQKMEALGLLAGGIAHDFNNVLMTMAGCSELALARLASDDPLRSLIDEIARASERGATLTRQLLLFSRQDGTAPRPVDLNRIVGGMERFLRRLIGDDVVLETRLDSTPAVVRADPGQLEQVLLNLAVNAREAMPDGGQLTIEIVSVEVADTASGARPTLALGSYACLRVRDTGLGIDPAVQARIFEPFFTTKEPGKGTGLGLSTVYGIVRQHGGEIRLDSDVGRGTTFEVYLPRVAGAAEEPADTAARPSAPRGTETILLVEDSPQVRGLLRAVLVANGYTVLEADSPTAALQISRQYPAAIHLLLTDVAMPGMSGLALAETLRPERPALSVLYMSGHSQESIARHTSAGPSIAFLQKPFTPTVLLARVREVLDAGGQPLFC